MHDYTLFFVHLLLLLRLLCTPENAVSLRAKYAATFHCLPRTFGAQ